MHQTADALKLLFGGGRGGGAVYRSSVREAAMSFRLERIREESNDLVLKINLWIEQLIDGVND